MAGLFFISSILLLTFRHLSRVLLSPTRLSATDCRHCLRRLGILKTMGRYCAECGDWCTNREFSRNQWMKGDGYSRCVNCVIPTHHSTISAAVVAYQHPPSYNCAECHREFNNQNELNMHMQVHRPRTVTCILCRERHFKCGANMVQHVESGYCTGCKGEDRARQQIYEFAQRQRKMQPYMNGTPLLTNGGGHNNRGGGVPDFPYQCRQCAKSFRQLSQLMQHQDNKHNNTRMLQY